MGQGAPAERRDAPRAIPVGRPEGWEQWEGWDELLASGESSLKAHHLPLLLLFYNGDKEAETLEVLL